MHIISVVCYPDCGCPSTLAWGSRDHSPAVFYFEVPQLQRLQKGPDLNLGIPKTSLSNFRSFLWDFFLSSLDCLCVAEDNNSKNNNNTFSGTIYEALCFCYNFAGTP